MTSTITHAAMYKEYASHPVRNALNVLRMLVTAFIYITLAKIGSWTVGSGTGQAFFTIWPAAGFALAVISRWGYVQALAVALGAFVWGVWFGDLSFAAALSLAMASTVSSLVAATIMRHLLGTNLSLENFRHLLLFFLSGPIFAGMIGATVAAGMLYGFKIIESGEFRALWGAWWFGTGTGMLLIAPIFLVWTSRTEINWSNKQAVEVALWLVALTFLSLTIFGNWLPSDTLGYPLELALFPIMAWGAIRFGQRGATSGVVILTIMALWPLVEVASGSREWSESSTLLWLFVNVATGTAYFLASIITEVREKEKQTALNESRLRAFIDALPDIAYVITADGLFQDVYAPAKRPIHDKALTMRGKATRDCWPELLAELFNETVKETLRTQKLQQLEYYIENDGERFWFEGRVAPMLDSGGQSDRVIWVAYEITERKRAEAALKHRDKLLDGVAEANRTLLSSREFDTGMNSAIRILGQRANVDRVNILKNGHDATGAPSGFLTHSWSANGIKALAVSESDPAHNWRMEAREIYNSLSENRNFSYLCKDLKADIRVYMDQAQTKSILFAPIWVERYFWGAVSFEDCTHERRWEESDHAALRVAAAGIGAFIQAKRGEEALRKAKESADNANAAKSEFLAMMSHEIRTPMNAILGFTDLLAQTSLEESQRDQLNIINRSGKSLLELINNILDFSKIESKGVNLELVPFNLEMAIMETLELVMVRARDKGLKVDFKIEGADVKNIIGDPTRLKQILLNLANNAVKFTHEGGITLKANIKPTKQSDRYRIYFEVIDTGIGIEPEKTNRLFKAFTQADSSTTRRFGGTGLGLVICKRLVEKMDGQIGVHSEPGKGSTFYFDILAIEAPDAVIPSRRAGVERLSEDFAEEYPLEILVVEDDPVNQQLDSEILGRLGYQSTIVGDGESALYTLQSRTFDLVLMDVELPGQSGLEIIRQIRAGQLDGVNESLFTVALTAYAMDEDRTRCMDAGASDFIAKPIDIGLLKSSMMKAHEAKMKSSV